METIKKYRGITLISLIVTIIIILIISGIAINTLIDNGIFNRAKEARDRSQNSQNDEEIQIAQYSNKIDNYKNNFRNDILPELLWTNPNLSSSFGNQTISLDLSSYKYVIIVVNGNTDVNNNENYPNCTGIIPVSDSIPENHYCIVGQKSTAPRRYYATSQGVVFSSYDNNERAIPRFIYGIKSDLGIKLDK